MSAPRRPLAVPIVLAALAAALGARAVSPGAGDPLPGLSPAERARFDAGKTAFEKEEDAADGLGPVLNGTSCVSCHSRPATGGASEETVTRFGRLLRGRFDPMVELGGSLIQSRGIGPTGSCDYVGETVPAEATIVARRLTTPLFGLGLVDAVPDHVFHEIALAQSHLAPDVAGRVAIVDDLASRRRAVGKFGWKCQNPSLLQFSADAYLNEMGVTSKLFPDESCPQGDCGALVCDPVPGIEDADGDVEAFADFMTFLAPPARGAVTAAVRDGEEVFRLTGCATCHVPSLTTGPSRVKALDRVELHPYSDFLLHDMGSLGDGIEQGAARGREMRTAPLWGLGSRTLLLHDGRARTVEDAIAGHDGQGRRARDRFRDLPASRRDALLAFLRSL